MAIFLLKIGIIWYRDIRKHPLLKLGGPIPSHSHNSVSWKHEIYRVLWKCMTRFLSLYYNIICILLLDALQLPKSPNYNILNTKSKKCTVLWAPLYYPSFAHHTLAPLLSLYRIYEMSWHYVNPVWNETVVLINSLLELSHHWVALGWVARYEFLIFIL